MALVIALSLFAQQRYVTPPGEGKDKKCLLVAPQGAVQSTCSAVLCVLYSTCCAILRILHGTCSAILGVLYGLIGSLTALLHSLVGSLTTCFNGLVSHLFAAFNDLAGCTIGYAGCCVLGGLLSAVCCCTDNLFGLVSRGRGGIACPTAHFFAYCRSCFAGRGFHSSGVRHYLRGDTVGHLGGGVGLAATTVQREYGGYKRAEQYGLFHNGLCVFGL